MLFTIAKALISDHWRLLSHAHSDSWEFPVMLKYAPGHGMIAPVVGAECNFRHINDFGNIPSYLFNGSTNATSVRIHGRCRIPIPCRTSKHHPGSSVYTLAKRKSGAIDRGRLRPRAERVAGSGRDYVLTSDDSMTGISS